jgi:hypothetical protein
VTKLQIAALILNAVVLNIMKYWYLYGTFIVLLLAPLPVVLIVGLVWLGYIWYRVYKAKEENA